MFFEAPIYIKKYWQAICDEISNEGNLNEAHA